MTESKMLKAFKEQQKFTDKEASDVLIEIEKIKQDNLKKGMAEMSKDQDVRKYVDIPTALRPGELNQTTEPHPALKGYDHSLDITRARIGVDGADILADGISIPESEQRGMTLNVRPEAIVEPLSDDANDPEFGIDWGALGDALGK